MKFRLLHATRRRGPSFGNHQVWHAPCLTVFSTTGLIGVRGNEREVSPIDADSGPAITKDIQCKISCT